MKLLFLCENFKKDLSKVLKSIARQGGRITKLKSGHLRVYPPDKTQDIIHVPGTPSDPRSMKNLIALLRRSGFDL